GLSLTEAMADFPTLQYRKVTYGIETTDFLALQPITPLTGNVTTPVFQRANRFLFNVPVTGNVSLTITVGNVGLPSNPGVDYKLYSPLGVLLKSGTLPSNSVSGSVSTTIALGRLGGNYDLDLLPKDNGLTYSITRSVSTVQNMAVKEGVDFTGPTAPLYFYVPFEVDTAFLLGNFDPSTPVQFLGPSGAAVTPLQVTSKVYALNTHGLAGVWKTSFKTSSLRAHLVNLPDVFSFDPSSVFATKVIRTDLSYGPLPSTS